MRRLRNGVGYLIAAVAVLSLTGTAAAHMDPYVLFIFRFTDLQGSPVTGLTVSLDLGPTGGEAPIAGGEAKVRVGFKWNYQGMVSLRVYDGKRRLIAAPISFPFSHQIGSGMQAKSGAAEFADFLNEGTVYPGSDGKMYDQPATAPAFRLEWTAARRDSAEAAGDARALGVDAAIATDLRARLAEIRKQRNGL